MGDSTIEWTNKTWNPVTGCSKVSPGCAHCYAESYTARMAGQRGWIEEHRPWTPDNAAHNVRLHPARLDLPLGWRKPAMVFVNSMSDLFHELVPDDYIAKVFAVMAQARKHTFQVLTKRPERMREWTGRVAICEHGWLTHNGDNPTSYGGTGIVIPSSDGTGDPEWPLANVWLGTSIENRRFVDRAVELGETPAAVRFISAEPLLGPLIPESQTIAVHGPDELDETWAWQDDYNGPGLRFYNSDGELAFHWLIAGGESGPEHRPVDPLWVRDLRDVCTHEGVAFFFKQWGGIRPKSGGRELDGRTWDEYPQCELVAHEGERA